MENVLVFAIVMLDILFNYLFGGGGYSFTFLLIIKTQPYKNNPSPEWLIANYANMTSKHTHKVFRWFYVIQINF